MTTKMTITKEGYEKIARSLMITSAIFNVPVSAVYKNITLDGNTLAESRCDNELLKAVIKHIYISTYPKWARPIMSVWFSIRYDVTLP